jgi:hypothetical protein
MHRKADQTAGFKSRGLALADVTFLSQGSRVVCASGAKGEERIGI